jgi:predicted Zn-dependent protease
MMKLLRGLWMLALPICVGASEPSPYAGADIEADSPRAAFSNDSYQLGYQVFLKNGDLHAAYQVARKALLARPNDPTWLLAFAQVAEWTGQPAEALKAWGRLARLTDNQQAWAAVGRLAPSLLDDEELLAYQEQALTRQPGNEVLIKDIARLYERLGRVEDGLVFFERLTARQGTELLLDTEATMAEHTGHDELALTLLKRLNHEYGPREGWLLRIAAMHYLHGEQAQAWEALHDAEPRMPKAAAGYWQTYAQLSGQLNHKKIAQKAYQTLVDAGKASASDLLEYVSLLESDDGLAAARLSETLFRTYGLESAMVTALFLYQREHQVMAAVAMLQLPTSVQLANLERNPDFLEQRGQLEWKQRNFVRAHADFAKGLSLRPGNPQLLLDLVSLAVDQADTDALRQLLPGYGHRAGRESNLWLAWANGWNALGKPVQALPFLQAYCRQHPHDAFALLALAETYANSGDTVMAETLRRRVQQAAIRQRDTAMPPDRTAALNYALLSLRLERLTPDAGQSLLQSRLKRGPDGQPDPASRDLVLSWLLAQGSDERAKAWMNRAYHGDAPVWAEVSLADSAEDQEALQHKVVSTTAARSADGRNELARSLAQKVAWTGLGETATFETLERNPDSEEAAEEFRSAMSGPSSWLGLRADGLQQSGLDRTQAGISWSAPLGEAWRLGADAGLINQRSNNPEILGKPPSGDRQSLHADYKTANNVWDASFSRTRLLDSYISAGLGQQAHPDTHLTLYWHADYNADAPESAPLLAIGTKDVLAAGFTVTLTGHWFVGARVEGSRFNTQHGDALGDGNEVNVEAGRHFTLVEIAQTLSLTALQSHFNTSTHALPADARSIVPSGSPVSAEFFMPTSFRQAGLHWSFGESSPAAYESRWRASGQLGVNYADSSGSGYDGSAEIHGGVFGHDRLRLALMQGKSGQNSGNIVRQATATYQYIY